MKNILANAKDVYGSVFDEKIFLEQLVYFGDLTNFDIIPASLTPLPNPEEIKQYFGELVQSYMSAEKT